jgi:hypothetical protein
MRISFRKLPSGLRVAAITLSSAPAFPFSTVAIDIPSSSSSKTTPHGTTPHTSFLCSNSKSQSHQNLFNHPSIIIIAAS